MEYLSAIMKDAIDQQVAAFDEVARSSAHLEMTQQLRSITINVFLTSVFGSTLSSRTREQARDALSYMARYSAQRQHAFIPLWLPQPGKREYDASVAFIRGLVDELIEEKRRDAGPAKNLLSMLVAASDDGEARLSQEEVRVEALSLLAAGWETTAATLSWIFYLLAANPSVQREVAHELLDVLGGRTPEFDDIPKLKWAEMVMYETLRLYPVSDYFTRVPIENDSVLGYDIPAGSDVVLSIYALHRHPVFWPQPERFRPERFRSGVTAASPHRFAYAAFSAGPRQCLGNEFAKLEIRLVLAALMQRYRVQFAAPDGGIEMNKNGIYMPTRLLVTAEPRSGVDGGER